MHLKRNHIVLLLPLYHQTIILTNATCERNQFLLRKETIPYKEGITHTEETQNIFIIMHTEKPHYKPKVVIVRL